jgi:hypothetical protein
MNHAKSPMGIPLSQFIFGSVLVPRIMADPGLAKSSSVIHITKNGEGRSISFKPVGRAYYADLVYVRFDK